MQVLDFEVKRRLNFFCNSSRYRNMGCFLKKYFLGRKPNLNYSCVGTITLISFEKPDVNVCFLQKGILYTELIFRSFLRNNYSKYFRNINRQNFVMKYNICKIVGCYSSFFKKIIFLRFFFLKFSKSVERLLWNSSAD